MIVRINKAITFNVIKSWNMVSFQKGTGKRRSNVLF